MNMTELVELQKLLFKLQKQVKDLEKRTRVIEGQVGQDVVDMRKEAKEVLAKATALVNPYSPNTITYSRK